MVQVLSMAWFQTPEATPNNWTLLLILVGIMALASLVQLAAFAAVGYFALTAKKKATEAINDIKKKSMPLIGKANDIVEDLKPKIKSVSDDVTSMSHTVKAKVEQIDQTVTQVNEKVRGQVEHIDQTITDLNDRVKAKVELVDQMLSDVNSKVRAHIDQADATVNDVQEKAKVQVTRVDDMVSTALKATSDISDTVQKSIKTPVLEVAGVVNGVKAGLDVLFGRSDGKGTRSRRGSSPSSAVAPSPGAEVVAEEIRRDKVTSIS